MGVVSAPSTRMEITVHNEHRTTAVRKRMRIWPFRWRKVVAVIAGPLLLAGSAVLAFSPPAQASPCTPWPSCFGTAYQVTGTSDNSLWEWTYSPNLGGSAIRSIPNGYTLWVGCQANNGPQEDNKFNIYPSVPSTTWDFAWDGGVNRYVWVYDWWMNTPPQKAAYNWYSWADSAHHCNFQAGSPNPNIGSDDYPWSPLCTYGDCGAGKVACSTSHGYCGDPWGMAYGQCVSFVAWKIYELYGGAQRPSPAQGTQNQNWRPSDPGVNGDPINSSWGAAANWANAATRAGKTVTQTPAVGDVAEWNANSKGMGSAGHVMMVVAVNSGNYITVAGYNTHLDGSYGKWNIPWHDNNWSGGAPYAPPWPDNFLVIH
jgi:surface antigen